MPRDTTAGLKAVDFGARPQAAAVARELKRLIHAGRLAAGDRLPPQAQLRESYGFHNNTLGTAMDILVTCGVLTRKRKVGTVVVDPNAPIPGLWRVGLTVIPATTEQTYFAQLMQYMQTHLQAVGVEVSLFMLNEPPEGQTHLTFADFAQLSETVAEGRLDGVLTQIGIEGEDWAVRQVQGLAMAHAGAWENAPAGVVIDHVPMVEDAVKRFVAAGCRRLAVVSQKGPGHGFRRFWDAFCHTSAQAGLAESAILSLAGGLGPYGGWRVAEQLLAMPAEGRPDGLIVLDDRVATGLTAILAGSNEGYAPQIAVQTNCQAPLAYAQPVVHYELDVEALAQRAVDDLMARMLNPELPLEQTYLTPALRSPEPRHIHIPTELLNKERSA